MRDLERPLRGRDALVPIHRLSGRIAAAVSATRVCKRLLIHLAHPLAVAAQRQRELALLEHATGALLLEVELVLEVTSRAREGDGAGVVPCNALAQHVRMRLRDARLAIARTRFGRQGADVALGRFQDRAIAT